MVTHAPHRPVALLLAAAACLVAAEAAPPTSPAKRVVSLYPSLTQTLVALGAGDALVGVDEYSARLEPAVRDLPTVGGLFNPSLEAVISLEPDLVVTVPTVQQRDLRSRLEGLGIPVLELRNISLQEALASIEALGARVGRAEAARARVERIRARWRETARSQPASPPRAVLVLQRDPLYVVGRGSFLDEMLAATGARNLGAVFDEPYPRASLEWLIASRPELILDASDDPEPATDYWQRWSSLPAVADGGVRSLPPAVTLPGPELDRALDLLARAVHGDASGRAPR